MALLWSTPAADSCDVSLQNAPLGFRRCRDLVWVCYMSFWRVFMCDCGGCCPGVSGVKHLLLRVWRDHSVRCCNAENVSFLLVTARPPLLCIHSLEAPSSQAAVVSSADVADHVRPRAWRVFGSCRVWTTAPCPGRPVETTAPPGRADRISDSRCRRSDQRRMLMLIPSSGGIGITRFGLLTQFTRLARVGVVLPIWKR